MHLDVAFQIRICLAVNFRTQSDTLTLDLRL